MAMLFPVLQSSIGNGLILWTIFGRHMQLCWCPSWKYDLADGVCTQQPEYAFALGRSKEVCSLGKLSLKAKLKYMAAIVLAHSLDPTVGGCEEMPSLIMTW